MSRSIGVTESLHNALPEWSLDLLGTFAVLGDLVLIVPILALLYLADVGGSLRRAGLGDRDSDRPLCSDRTVFLVAAVFGGLALVVLLKASIGLSRPPVELHADGVSPSEYGFPSGHTMAATIFWGALALWTTIGRRSTRVTLAGVIVTLVGLSRLALGVHYLVDVLASVALGGLYLAVIVWVARGRPKRAFAIAIAIAVVAMAATGGSTRAVLALAGTVVASVGWLVVERPVVRGRVFDLAERMH